VPGGAAAAPTPPPEPPPAKEALSEAQIAKITELVNTAEVDQGRVAQRKAKAPAVKKFAEMMIKHHTDGKQEQAKLFKKLNLTPAESATASALKADGDSTLKTLNDADAASFDAAYIRSQVDGHQKALDALDAQLLPAAKTPELADGLRKMRATVEAHLAEARKLQASP
jgi:putative membrane protein